MIEWIESAHAYIKANAYTILVYGVILFFLVGVKSCFGQVPDLFIGETGAGMDDLFSEPPKVAKVEPPKAEPPKAEPPKAEPPKAEPPKAEPPKAEPVKVIFPDDDEPSPWPKPEPRAELFYAGDLTALSAAVKSSDALGYDLVVLVGQPESRVEWERSTAASKRKVVVVLDEGCGMPVSVHEFIRTELGALTRKASKAVQGTIEPSVVTETICRGGKCYTRQRRR